MTWFQTDLVYSHIRAVRTRSLRINRKDRRIKEATSLSGAKLNKSKRFLNGPIVMPVNSSRMNSMLLIPSVSLFYRGFSPEDSLAFRQILAEMFQLLKSFVRQSIARLHKPVQPLGLPGFLVNQVKPQENRRDGSQPICVKALTPTMLPPQFCTILQAWLDFAATPRDTH